MAFEFSLAQFNKIATGDYNAGQIDIKVGANGKAELVKVNNHVWKTSKNDVVLSPERILEVKEAFLNALATLAVDPRDGHLHLQKYNWLERLDGEKVLSGLMRFADTVKTWRGLASAAPADPPGHREMWARMP